MKEIILNKGMVAIVDDEDYDRINKYKWYVCKNKSGNVSAKRNYFYNGKNHGVYMHREIVNATDPNIPVDHINHNRLDNRKENLRICTQLQNAANKKIYTNNKTGYKGCTLNKITGKYLAGIRVNNKQIWLGTYETAKEAALIYNKAASFYFGEFALLNEI